MTIIEKKLTDVIPYENNPRKNDEAVEYVIKSIKDFGFKIPIIIDRNGIIVTGHTRYKAAQKLGMETIPCIIADDLTDEQIKAFRLADNKVGENAEWDYNLLSEEIDRLCDFNFEEYGFDNIEVDDDISNDFLETKTDPGLFGVTLSFSSDSKQIINRYIKKNGKEYIVNELIDFIRKENEENEKGDNN